MLFKVILQRLSWRSSVGTGTVRRHATLYKRSALLTQFNQLKEQHQNHILLFQVGDFYEIYGQDAGSESLQALTVLVIVITELVAAKTNLQMTRRLNTSMAGRTLTTCILTVYFIKVSNLEQQDVILMLLLQLVKLGE